MTTVTPSYCESSAWLYKSQQLFSCPSPEPAIASPQQQGAPSTRHPSEPQGGTEGRAEAGLGRGRTQAVSRGLTGSSSPWALRLGLRAGPGFSHFWAQSLQGKVRGAHEQGLAKKGAGQRPSGCPSPLVWTEEPCASGPLPWGQLVPPFSAVMLSHLSARSEGSQARRDVSGEFCKQTHTD